MALRTWSRLQASHMITLSHRPAPTLCDLSAHPKQAVFTHCSSPTNNTTPITPVMLSHKPLYPTQPVLSHMSHCPAVLPVQNTNQAEFVLQLGALSIVPYLAEHLLEYGFIRTFLTLLHQARVEGSVPRCCTRRG